MMSQSRNKFIDRFRTHIIKPTAERSQQKTEKHLNSNPSCHIRSSQGQRSISRTDIHEIIVEKLEKHIQYLQKKLKDAEQDNEKLSNHIDSCQKKIMEQDASHQNLIEQIELLQQNAKRIILENQLIKSDYENVVLKQKMQKLSEEVNVKKEAYSKLQLKHQQHKQGKFSAAFLPGSFGSSNKYTERDSKNYDRIIEEYEAKNVKEIAALPKNSINNCLLNEWKQKKEENQRLLKEISELKLKNKCLQEQFQKQKRSAEDERALKDNINLLHLQVKHKLQQSLDENKLLMNKLRQTEERMIEISQAIKQRSDLCLNELFASSLSEIQQLHKENSSSLQIVREVIKLTLPISCKLEKEMQTDKTINPEVREDSQSNQLQERIEALGRMLEERNKQLQRYKMQQKVEVNDLFNFMKKCNDNIEQFDQSREETTQNLYRDEGYKSEEHEKSSEEKQEDIHAQLITTMERSLQ